MTKFKSVGICQRDVLLGSLRGIAALVLFLLLAGNGAEIARWTLADSAGQAISDAVGAHAGSAVGTPSFGEPGVNDYLLKHSLSFDGVEDGAAVAGLPALDVFSITFWMKARSAGGCPVARSQFNKPWSLELVSGGDAGQARLTCWINNFTTQVQHFNLSFRLEEWVHVVFVLDTSRDSLWLYLNGAPGQAGKGLSNYADDGSQALTFGKRGDGAFYNGWLAGIGLFDHAMTAEEVRLLYISESGKVTRQQPADQGYLKPETAVLSWLPHPQNSGHYVYVGSERGAVVSAGPASPEFLGLTHESRFAVSLDENTEYFWRVDEAFPGDVTVKGDVLSFTYGNPARLFREWGQEAMGRMDELFLRNDHLFAVSSKSGVQGGNPAFIWGQAVAWLALNSTAANVDGAFAARIQNEFRPAVTGRYRYQYNNLWGYNAWANNTGGPDRYIDDNGHLIVAMMELFALTGDQTLMDEAELLMAFEMAYENDAPGFGGMPWHETMDGSRQNQTLNGVASTLATQAALMVYEATEDPQYLDFALRIYDYLHANGMVRDDGIVYEGMSIDGNYNRGYLSYVTDYFLESDLILHRVTGNPDYLAMARKRGDAIYNAKIDKLTGGMGDTGQWGGYSHSQALASLYKADPDPKWRKMLFRMLKCLHDRNGENGLYGEYWNREYTDLANADIDLLHQASAVIGFMEAADSTLWEADEEVSLSKPGNREEENSSAFRAVWKNPAVRGNQLILQVPFELRGKHLHAALHDISGRLYGDVEVSRAGTEISFDVIPGVGTYLLKTEAAGKTAWSTIAVVSN